MDTRGRRALWSLGDDGRCGHYGAMGIVVTRGGGGGDGHCGH